MYRFIVQLSGEWDYDEDARSITLTVWQGEHDDEGEEDGYDTDEEEEGGCGLVDVRVNGGVTRMHGRS